ncbi:hypothetical protein [Microbacterium aurum]
MRTAPRAAREAAVLFPEHNWAEALVTRGASRDATGLGRGIRS